MRTLILIPAYNEEQAIVPVVEQLNNEYPQFDYVIINDGSTDKTGKICRENGYPIIDLPINLGLAGAVATGMKYAWEKGYDAAIQFDADGQHLPEYIAPMRDKLAQGHDIVIASRFLTRKKPRTLRMLGSFLISFAIHITTRKKLTDPTSGMRMYNRRMIYEMAHRLNCPPEPDTISYLIKRGADVVELQVDMSERMAGESYLNLTRSIGYMLRMGISILLMQPFRGKSLFHAPEEREVTV